ncbi:hypothetical protein ABF681_001227 [Campylobacter upsaliensis]|nr:hypothetical protein [Campylobacter upsaliensis]
MKQIKRIYKEIKKLNHKHQILNLLSGVNYAFKNINTKQKNSYYLIALHLNQKQLSFYPFNQNDLNTQVFYIKSLKKMKILMLF